MIFDGSGSRKATDCNQMGRWLARDHHEAINNTARTQTPGKLSYAGSHRQRGQMSKTRCLSRCHETDEKVMLSKVRVADESLMYCPELNS